MRSRFRQEKRCQGVKSVQTGQIAANRPPVASLEPNNCLSGNTASPFRFRVLFVFELLSGLVVI